MADFLGFLFEIMKLIGILLVLLSPLILIFFVFAEIIEFREKREKERAERAALERSASEERSARARAAKEKQAQLEYAAERKRQEALTRRREAQEDLARLKASAISNVTSAQRIGVTIQEVSTDAQRHLEEAQRHFQASAHNSFWSSIDDGFVALSRIERDLRSLLISLTREYEYNVRSYQAKGGVESIPDFPTVTGAQSAAKRAKLTAHRLQALAYEAEKHQTYAIVFEQRRTTYAIVAGYHTMQQALHSIEAELHELSSRGGGTSGF